MCRSKFHNYDDVVERVAHRLGLDDPSKIRLTSHNCYSQTPKPQPIKYRGVEHLFDMLVHYNQVSDILVSLFDIADHAYIFPITYVAQKLKRNCFYSLLIDFRYPIL